MSCVFAYASGDLPLNTIIAQWVAFGVKVAALIALGYIGKECFAQLISAMQQQPPGVETSWGGLGGSLGGWNVSRSLAWFVASLMVLVLFAALASQVGDGLFVPPNAGTAAEQKKSAEQNKGAEQKNAEKEVALPAAQTKTDAGKGEPAKNEQKTDTPAKKDAPKPDSPKQ